MNLFIFTGNLGRDAETKVLPSGSTVCEFSVAVESGYGDNAKTNWVRCALFGKRAEGGLPKYLVKGAQVAVSGELELQEWEGQNGKGAALAVRVSEIDLIGGKGEGAPQGQPQQSAPAPQQQAQPQSYGSFDDPWKDLVPDGEAKANGATIEAIKAHKQINGDASKAKQLGWVAESIDSQIPF